MRCSQDRAPSGLVGRR